MTDLPQKANLLPREVQNFLQISRATLYRWLSRGIIPAVKLNGNGYRIPREMFLEWYQKQRT